MWAYLIARLNLAIHEQSEKFWYGINDKASMGEYGKELERMGEYRKFGRVMDGGGIEEFLVVFGVGIWKEWENMEEKWGSVLGCGGGVADVGKYEGGVELCMG